MTYTPPGPTSLHFDFTQVLITIVFDFTGSGYSPPAGNALHFDLLIALYPMHFEFAPEVPPPISKEMLLSLGLRFSGQVYKYWICQMSHGGQQVRRYVIPPDPKTAPQVECRSKFARAVKAALALSPPERLYWRDIGMDKKEPLPWWNAFIQAFMKDKV